MGILDTIRESILLVIKDFMRNIEGELSKTLARSMNRVKKQIMKELMAMFIIIISIGLLAISAVFFLIEYIHLNKTLSFLILGVIILIIGILVKLVN